MKARIVGLIIVFILLTFCSCNTRHISVEQSKANFVVYEENLQEIVKKYNLVLEEKISKIEGSSDEIKEFHIVSTNFEIVIWLGNSAIDSNKGVESFTVDYYLQKSNFCDDYSEFNLDLFVDLVNCISAKKISGDMCRDFLDSPENKYSSEKYGYTKREEENVKKVYPLNFFEDWVLFYTSNSNGEVLTFGGLSLQIEQ